MNYDFVELSIVKTLISLIDSTVKAFHVHLPHNLKKVYVCRKTIQSMYIDKVNNFKEKVNDPFAWFTVPSKKLPCYNKRYNINGLSVYFPLLSNEYVFINMKFWSCFSYFVV